MEAVTSPAIPSITVLTDDNNLLMLNNMDEDLNESSSLLDFQTGVGQFDFEKLFELPETTGNNNDNINTNGPAAVPTRVKNTQVSYNMNLNPRIQGKGAGFNIDLENELRVVNTNNTLVNNPTSEMEVYSNEGLTNDTTNNTMTLSDSTNSNTFANSASSNLTPTAIDDFYNDKFLNELDWDINSNNVDNVDNMSTLYGDSTTLASESRTSHEYRTSNEFFESLSQLEIDPQQSSRSRFTSSISNSISSIFKTNNNTSNSRFNLRVINPLSTHKDPELFVQNLQDLEENMDVEQDELPTNPKKKKCTKHFHSKNCDCGEAEAKPSAVPMKKRNYTNSLVSALSNARLGFNRQPQQQEDRSKQSSRGQTPTDLQSDIITEENEEEEEEEDDQEFDFNEELTKVISLASMNSSSNYNFNAQTSNDKLYVPSSLQNEQGSIKQEEKEDQEESVKEGSPHHSPDYAALFADMNTKKRSKSLSLKKSSNFKDAKFTTLPPLPENAQLPIPPLNEPPRRGRKPTTEYDPTKTFVCTYCLRRFRRQEHLKRHFRSLHTNQKPFDCHLCHKKFSRSDNLSQHIKTHANDEDQEMEEDQ